MNFQKSLLSVAIATSVVGLTACSSSSDDKKDEKVAFCELVKPATSHKLTLTNDNIYVLGAGFPGTVIGNGDKECTGKTVHDDITLEIEPGTLIYGSEKEALVVSRGSKIMAKGTKEDPIVFTSKKQFESDDGKSGRGDWAGLALMGYAKSNECGTPCNVAAEGDIGYYGGTQDSDSSGELTYVVVRHAGNDIDGKGNELNGFTLFGTGSETKMNHIQVHKGLDDGIEHFGSADFMSHIVLTDNRDDSFDWGQGYTGGVQFMVVKQADDEANAGIEADNDKDAPSAAPISKPTLANVTFIGSKAEKSIGAVLRRGTGANIHNAIFTGFKNGCLDVDGTATMKMAHNGTEYTGALTVDNTIIECTPDLVTGDDDFAGAGTQTMEQWFTGSGSKNDKEATVDLNSYGLPEGDFATAVTGLDYTATNSNFVNTNYAGAFDPNATEPNWTEGWTVGLNGNSKVWAPASAGTLAGTTPAADQTCPAGTKRIGEVDVEGGKMDVCQLKGRYTAEDFTAK